MAIYLKIPHVTGNVTTKEYKGWIEISSMRFRVKRKMAFTPNKQTNRTVGSVHFSEFELVKELDGASHFIMESIETAHSISKIDIHCCTTGSEITPYAKYELSNVMFTDQDNLGSEYGMMRERILLHYTKIQRTYIPRDEKNQPKSPSMTGYDLDKMEKI